MTLPVRLSVLFLIGVLAAGSTALSYYYYYVYSPPLKAAERFMNAMEAGDPDWLKSAIVMSSGEDDSLREPADGEVRELLDAGFERGRILDQRKREGKSQDYYYLVYREPDGRVYALVVTEVDGDFRVVVPETPMSSRRLYLWDYTWTN